MDTVETTRPAPITRYTPVAELPELLNSEEARTWLDIESDHFYRLVAEKKIKSIRLGRLIKIPRAALEQMVTK